MTEEWLLIGIDNSARWRRDKPDKKRLAADIRSRSKEARKSAWAHSPDNYRCHPHAVLRPVIEICRRVRIPRSVAQYCLGLAPNLVSRRLQALSLFLFRARADQLWLADIAHFVSINSNLWNREIVEVIPDTHIVSAYDRTHRELAFASEQDRENAIDAVFSAQQPHKAFLALEYTFDELRPLLTALVEARLLRDEYIAVAERLLNQTNGENDQASDAK